MVRWPTLFVKGPGGDSARETTRARPPTFSGGVTRIGDRNLFMAYAHIAHDANVGSRIVFARR